MAYTQADAEAKWKEDNPPPIVIQEAGEEPREATPEEYEAMAVDGGTYLLLTWEAQQAHLEEQAEEQGILDEADWLAKTATDLENTALTMTFQQMRNVTAHHMRITERVIRYLNRQQATPPLEPTFMLP
jgi:hypothetical protein